MALINESIIPNKEKGLSVHYLREHFIGEVLKAGYKRNSAVREIEDLRNDEHGVIRSKGSKVKCPRDGKMGASYSDCLMGDDNIGPATLMLSYTWQYPIGDIVDTLVSHCELNHLDEKRTYVWICCLCNNQHRVYEKRKKGIDVPFKEFHKTFRDNVVNIGHIIAMMSPWKKPTYLERIWCIFELYTAHAPDNNCKVTIVMPPREETDMMNAIGDTINELFKVLAATRIENAEASVEDDRLKILKLVEDNVGFFELNQAVNGMIRKWVMDTLEARAEKQLEYKVQSNTAEENSKNADLFNSIGALMMENGEHDKALKYFNLALEEISSFVTESGDERVNIIAATASNGVGEVYESKGDYDKALSQLQKALDIQLKVLGADHPDTPRSYGNIGLVYDRKGDYDKALSQYRKALDIRLKVLGGDHVDTASSYNNIGTLYDSKGDHDKALSQYQKALDIQLKVLGTDHPDTANSYNNIGNVYSRKGYYDKALSRYQKCLGIRLKLLGADNISNATCYNNIGMIYRSKGNYDKALPQLQKALDIRLKVLGADHPDTANSYNKIGEVYDSKGDYDKALSAHQTALGIRLRVLGVDHPNTALSYNDVGDVYEIKGDYDKALSQYQKCLDIRLKVLGADHPDTASSYNDFGDLYDSKGDYDKALSQYKKALDIQLKVLGVDHPDTLESKKNIEDTMFQLQGYRRKNVCSNCVLQ